MMRYLLISLFFIRCIYSSNTTQIDSINNVLASKTNYVEILNLKFKLAQAYFKDKDLQGEKPLNDVIIGFKKLNLKNELGLSYGLRANYNLYQSKYDDAINDNLLAIELFESTKNWDEANIKKKNLGSAYYSIHKYDIALKYLLESQKYFEGSNNKTALSGAYNNLGLVYMAIDKLDSSLYFHTKSLVIKEELKDANGIANSKNNIGNILFTKKDYKNAIRYFESALKTKQEIEEVDGIINALQNLSRCYYSLEQPDKALGYVKDAEKVCTKNNKLEGLMDVYYMYSNLAQERNDFKSALTFLAMGDSIERVIFDKEGNERILELETKYQTDKKEKELQLNKLELNKRNIIIYSAIGGLILIAVFAAFVYKGYRQKLLDHKIIVAQKELVEKKNKLIEIQKNEVEVKNKEITDSIAYDKRIQTALLASEEKMEFNLGTNNHFTFFKPKDIVSGDFYWSTEIQNYLGQNLFYLGCCDSTGHGVPGAFMSILNIGFLSEAVKEKNIFKPGDIFNYARSRLIETISKDGQQDGFDGILLCINTTTKKVTYAAANNKPLLVRNAAYSELAGDKMPVGQGVRTESFKTYEHQCEPGDILYLYTDGYADQFGGPKGKKFKYKKLNELLLSTSSASALQQKENLKLEFEDWKGNLEQVDDVLIIGLKF